MMTGTLPDASHQLDKFSDGAPFCGACKAVTMQVLARPCPVAPLAGAPQNPGVVIKIVCNDRGALGAAANLCALAAHPVPHVVAHLVDEVDVDSK